MKLIKTISFLIIIITISCNKGRVNKVSEAQKIINFSLTNDLKDEATFFKLIDSLKLLRLKTNRNFLISSISKIELDEDFIYILDKTAKTLFKYDLNGEGVLKISNIGKGPGEFYRPTDFSLLNDRLVILDGYIGKLLYYTKEGKFIKEVNSGTDAENFSLINDSLFAMFHNNRNLKENNNIDIIDSNGVKLKSFFEIPSYIKNNSLELYKNTDKVNGKQLFTTTFCNNVFQITNDSFVKRYFFDFGDYNLKPEFLIKNENTNGGELWADLNQKDVVFSIDFFNETPENLFFQFVKNSKIYHAYYNGTTKNSFLFNRSEFPLWLKSLNRTYIYSAYDKELFISTINSPKLTYLKLLEKGSLDRIQENKLYKDVFNFLKESNEGDNPILLLHYFK